MSEYLGEYSQQHVGGGRSQPHPHSGFGSRLAASVSQLCAFGLAMADQKQGDCGEDECVNAFKRGNKQVAEQLLPHTRPANVRTTFEFSVDRELIR